MGSNSKSASETLLDSTFSVAMALRIGIALVASLILYSCKESSDKTREAEIAVAKATPNIVEPVSEVVNGLYSNLGIGDSRFLAGDYSLAGDNYTYVKGRIDSLKEFYSSSGRSNRLAGTSLAIENRLLLLEAATKLKEQQADPSR